MHQSLATRLAAAMGFLAVALGAFGAHGLKTLLAQNGTAAIWEKAVFYHFSSAFSFSPARFICWRRRICFGSAR
jgi:uncharacterized membrane protein YgdD (TMEM256/DUF423 family)